MRSMVAIASPAPFTVMSDNSATCRGRSESSGADVKKEGTALQVCEYVCDVSTGLRACVRACKSEWPLVCGHKKRTHAPNVPIQANVVQIKLGGFNLAGVLLRKKEQCPTRGREAITHMKKSDNARLEEEKQ